MPFDRDGSSSGRAGAAGPATAAVPAPHGHDRWPSRRDVVVAGAAAGGLAALGWGAQARWRSHSRLTTAELLRTHPFVVAHRGGSRDWPEMSLFAYEQALAHGVRALEMSLGRTSDGVWFGLHDPALDRTSGTRGFLASAHTWAQVGEERISGATTRDPSQRARPYLRLEDFLEHFAARCVLFLDPKAVGSQFYPELVGLLRARVAEPGSTIVGKSPAGNTTWASAASSLGCRTWGFYYGHDLDADPTALARTQGAWDLLGLDVAAGPRQWSDMTSCGKPVIGHVVATKEQMRSVVSRGGRGVVVSDVLRVLGPG